MHERAAAAAAATTSNDAGSNRPFEMSEKEKELEQLKVVSVKIGLFYFGKK
jgi:hypothetical protein